MIVISTVFLNWGYFRPAVFYGVTDEEKLSGSKWDVQKKAAILDYLPKTALEPREPAPEQPIFVSGGGNIENYKLNSKSWRFESRVDQKAIIEVPVFYFSNWEVAVNGEPYSYSYKNLIGRIQVELERGDYEVIGRFKNTPIRTSSNILSLLSIMTLFYLLFNYEKTGKIYR